MDTAGKLAEDMDAIMICVAAENINLRHSDNRFA